MDGMNHCVVTRADLRAALREAGLLESRVVVPDDGAALVFA
jgi:hypothetical protein